MSVSTFFALIFGLLLIVLNKYVAAIQKRIASGKTDIVSKRIQNRSRKDLRLLALFVGVGFLLIGIARLLSGV